MRWENYSRRTPRDIHVHAACGMLGRPASLVSLRSLWLRVFGSGYVSVKGAGGRVVPFGGTQQRVWAGLTRTDPHSFLGLRQHAIHSELDRERVACCFQESGAYALGRSELEREWASQWNQDLPCNLATPGKVGFMQKLADLHDSPTAGFQTLKSPRKYRENRIPIYFGCMVCCHEALCDSAHSALQRIILGQLSKLCQVLKISLS